MEKNQTQTNQIFPTFFHINDYDKAGYADLPRYIATSYPLVLWAPSGHLLERSYRDPLNACDVSPEQFIKLVQDNHIQIIGRENWFDKNWRNKHRWSGAHWLDGFDDALLGILREREREPLSSRSVRFVEDEDGDKWAKEYLDQKQSGIIDVVVRLINARKVPEGVIAKASDALTKGDRRQAVAHVLRDLRNHVQAKNLAGAKVFLLSQNDADFFRLIEAEGSIVDVKKELVVSADMGRAIISMVERLSQPEHVISLDSFAGSSLHQELASWFNQATDVANTFLPKDFNTFLKEQLLKDATEGRLSESLTRRLRQHCPLFAPVDKVESDDFLTWLIHEVIDPDDTLGTSATSIGDVPVISGISRDVELVHANDEYSAHLT